MNRLEFISPEQEHKEQVLEFRSACLDRGEETIHGGSLLEEYEDYSEWLRFVKRNKHLKTTPAGWVPSTTYLAFTKEEGRLAGIVNIRHVLNKNLEMCGGHAGYSVAPSLQGQGYGSELLSFALEDLRKRGVFRALITCGNENLPSQKVIERVGGKLENEVVVNGEIVRRYWFSLE